LRNENAWQVSTNFIICTTEFDGANSPCWRYNLAYSRLEQNQGVITPSQPIEILNAVSQANTIWSLLYNVTLGDIQVVMARDYDHVYNWELGTRN